MQNQVVSGQKSQDLTNTNKLLTTQPLLNRGMTLEESKIMCTDHMIPQREKLYFRIIYETELRPFEVLNLQIEDWDRRQCLVTAKIVKQKTKPVKGDRSKKVWLPSLPKTRAITENTNNMLRDCVSNRKRGSIFINEKGKQLSLAWFNHQISYYAKLIGIQKVVKHYVDGKRTLKLITCMALREAGERHHDNAGGSRKISAAAADHTMSVKELHYEKVGEDVEQIIQSYKKFHPAFTEKW